ncbi:MAG: tail-specific protease [Bacteroidetes bacterium]|nr:MAG: tail-specific protease [Bacteroidota bacterium]
MKRNINILLLTLLLAFASCSFTTKKLEQSDDKEKDLVQLITYVLEQGHFQPKDMNDEFSANVYEDYLNQIDPFKRYFYESDIKEFSAFKNEIDNQLMAYDLSFFSLTHERLIERMNESKELYKEVLAQPFDFSKSEEFNADYKELGYVNSKKEMKERWKQQLKFSAIANYHDLVKDQENEAERLLKIKSMSEAEREKALKKAVNNDFKKKSEAELEIEARESTLSSLNELYSFIDDRRREDWFAVFLNAVVVEFDPHTYYFAPEAKEQFDVDISGNYEGIGARLYKKMDYITISEIISGGSAWRQNKLEVGDIILKVRQENEEEGVNVVGMPTRDAVKFIKGPKGSNVILTLKKVDGTIEDLSIPRDVIELEERKVKTSIVEKDSKPYGVISLPAFYADFDDYNKNNAASDVKREIERLKADGMEGLVLDLRNNGGGSLKTVVEMVGLFIKEGPVVQVRSTGEPQEVLQDRDRSITWDGPLVVLVNENSASASEILAAAIQDYKRGIVIGSKQTYGKGTVQIVLDLNRMMRNNTNGDMGALKFTTQKYYRIDGGSTQLEGVKSDVVVPDRYSYIKIGERDQENPLPWDKIEPAEYSIWDSYFDYESTIEKSKERMKNSEQLKLIDENAKWIKTIRDRNMFSLNYDDYRRKLEENEQEAKSFDKIAEYETNLSYQSLPYEVKLMELDSVLKIKRERWHESLAKDVYMEEALNVLNDLKMTYGIKKVTTVKD